METHADPVRRQAQHGRDLARREALPRGECQDLSILLAQPGQGPEGDVRAVVERRLGVLPRDAELRREPVGEHAGGPAAAGPLLEEVARHAEQPETCLLAHRDGLEPAPGDQVRLREEIGRFLGPGAAGEVAEQIGSGPAEEVLELRGSRVLGHRRHERAFRSPAESRARNAGSYNEHRPSP
jgi:hypothetical protein